jgi:hypothetical protein
MKKLFIIMLLVLAAYANAQVKIGDNPNTINPNSLLELESTNKGFLPPRIALNDASSMAPLTSPVPQGMLVYSIGGTFADGYYFWNGTQWNLLETKELNAVTKSADATLTKIETFVLASGDITLTLPSITASDNGLAITIKNIGTHTDLVIVQGNSGSTIDGAGTSDLTKHCGQTYVAHESNWVVKEKVIQGENVFDVNAKSSWTTIEEALEFLNEHMSGPTVLRLSGGSYEISSTMEIDLPFPLTIQGASYGKAMVEAASGLEGKPMFRCLSECYFKMLAFDGSTLGGYGNSVGEDAIRLVTGGEYFEVKDCSITQFNKGIVAESNVELWLFETDIIDAVAAGVEIAAGVSSDVTLKVSETDFLNCGKGINLVSGTGAVVSILNCGFYNNTGSQVGVNYVPATFTTFSSMFITNNSWNNIGSFFNGFDFSRADGRDAETFIQNNAGDGDKNPSCRLSVADNIATTNLATANSFVKANWTNTSHVTTKWKVEDNKITYLSKNKRDGWAIITGNLSVNSNNETITICIVKNGQVVNRIGSTDLRIITGNQPFQFSTVIYLTDIGLNDYFEVYCASSTGSDIVTFRDVQWFTDTK